MGQFKGILQHYDLHSTLTMHSSATVLPLEPKELETENVCHNQDMLQG